MSHAINNYLRKAENKGRKDGRKAQQQETAANMIRAGFNDHQIAELTAMPQKDVEAKRKSMQMK